MPDARRNPTPFDLGDTSLTSIEAIDLAGERLGAEVVDHCGPLRSVDVRGARCADGLQSWGVEFRIGGQVHTAWLDAHSGTVDNIDQQPC